MLFAENTSLFAMETIPSYKSAPLPFMGQKKNFLESFRRILLQKAIENDVVILDVFGGSGLLSHHLKRWYPHNKVVWNDFDNYQSRLALAPITQAIKQALEARFDFKRFSKSKALPQEIRAQILEVFAHFIQQYGEQNIDFITLSSYFLFAGLYAHNFDEFQSIRGQFHNRYSYKTIETQGYLAGVTRESMDFRALLEKYAHTKTLLVLDPPYLQTERSNLFYSFFTK